ncbi:hypothetical protein RB195_025026 [Necator americanus]|uniref:Toxin-antitoxin system, antitoxin component, ribbon-helix-helix domain protein n=1 Tax=Necator americanus TaxID=51031 RepID=A0ABR1EQK4_NECAM
MRNTTGSLNTFTASRRRLIVSKPPRDAYLELICQRGAAREAGNQELTSKLARLCGESVEEYLKERRAEVMAEAAEADKSIHYDR